MDDAHASNAPTAQSSKKNSACFRSQLIKLAISCSPLVQGPIGCLLILKTGKVSVVKEDIKIASGGAGRRFR
jgi:hypothetical protein